MNSMKFYLVEAFPQLASPAVVFGSRPAAHPAKPDSGFAVKILAVVKAMRLPVADFIEAGFASEERRHIKVCEGPISSAADVTVVDRAVARRRQWMANYAVRFCPIASNCAFCSSLSVA